MDEASATPIGDDRPADLAAPVQFTTGGVDGVPTAGDFIGDPAAHTGFYAFDPFDVQLVTLRADRPGDRRSAGIAYCEGRGDCMYVGAVPERFVEAGTAIAYGQASRARRSTARSTARGSRSTDPIGVGDPRRSRRSRRPAT